MSDLVVLVSSERFLVFALVCFVPLVSGCLAGASDDTPDSGSTAPVVPDPLADGDHAFTVHEYDFGYTTVQGRSNEPYLVWMHGNLHLPTGEGPFPLIVFQHGRHGTCDYQVREFFSPFACPDAGVVHPVDSYTGYDHMARHLATHGYAVVSIDTNDINDQDLALGTAAQDAGGWPRAKLVLDTIDAFAQRNQSTTAPPMPSLEGSALHGDDGIGDVVVGKLDLGRIGLMGHSRGGEGVATVVEANAERDAPYTIRGVFSLAPIDARRTIVTDVPWATLLPYCDGDVSRLSGARIYDHSREQPGNIAPLVQIEVLGTNHNWFNSIWTQDDNGASNDPYCTNEGVGRFTFQEQLELGLGTMMPFLRWTVGDEEAFAPLYTRSVEFPDQVCPRFGCRDTVHVSYQAPASHHLMVEDGRGNPLHTNDLGGDTTITSLGSVTAKQCRGSGCPAEKTRGDAWQLAFEHDGGFTYATDFDAIDVAAFDMLSFRLITTKDVWLNVTLHDAAGRSMTRIVEHPAVFVPPAITQKAHVLNMVRMDVAGFDELDLEQVTAIEIGATAPGRGTVQLTDLMFQHDLEGA